MPTNNAKGLEEVLAVMDRGIADLMSGHATLWTARDVRAMRAAVAELVAAVADVYGAGAGREPCKGPCQTCRIRAALAKVASNGGEG